MQIDHIKNNKIKLTYYYKLQNFDYQPNIVNNLIFIIMNQIVIYSYYFFIKI
jgi:hypothetical protein